MLRAHIDIYYESPNGIVTAGLKQCMFLHARNEHNKDTIKNNIWT
jgi:hypothetical protein